MMAKRPEDRPPSMWEFLKQFRNMQIFVKRPRKPKISVFDNMPGIKGADDMIRKPQQGLESDDEFEQRQQSGEQEP
jgi:hypothetical protein